MATPRLMGAEVKRKEDPRLITGTSSYVGDLALPGMHYVAFVRSPHAHARVKRIDVSAAFRRPGVFKVVTGSDIRKLCAPLPVAGAGEGGGGDAAANTGRKHYPLSVDRVRHVGEAVAADRKSTRLNSSHDQISYAVFCLKKKKQHRPKESLLVSNTARDAL